MFRALGTRCVSVKLYLADAGTQLATRLRKRLRLSKHLLGTFSPRPPYR